MRKAFALSLLLATAACGRPDEGSRQSRESLQAEPVASGGNMTADVDDSSAGPGVAPTAAPGVAFNYQYAFRLAAERIKDVQKQHAAACEKLGLDHCRITGMRYRLVGNRDVEAMLSFKVDPALARAFGDQAAEAVGQAEGLLVDAEINGTDAGAKIAQANLTAGSLSDQLKQVEAQLAKPGLSGRERAELQNEAQDLRERIRSAQDEKKEQQASLATTPMTFEYATGDLNDGFGGRPRLKQALVHAGDNLVGGALWILVIAISLLPWALVAALGWWGWRRLRARLERRQAIADAAFMANPPEA